ncbi:hypothetical protein BC834DRAFT_263007 [Gloeopeniophorella convolvens]|nr:hypothetical protein BC834DRAFT_263007 [Gloeopeniophorella convolvens]
MLVPIIACPALQWLTVGCAHLRGGVSTDSKDERGHSLRRHVRRKEAATPSTFTHHLLIQTTSSTGSSNMELNRSRGPALKAYPSHRRTFRQLTTSNGVSEGTRTSEMAALSAAEYALIRVLQKSGCQMHRFPAASGSHQA